MWAMRSQLWNGEQFSQLGSPEHGLPRGYHPLKLGIHLTWPHKPRAETSGVEGRVAVHQSESIMACSWEASCGIRGIASMAWHTSALPALERTPVV